MENTKTETWPDLAIGLYDKLTGRNAKITYQFEDMTVHVPSGVNSTEKAEWKLNGKLTVSTSEN